MILEEEKNAFVTRANALKRIKNLNKKIIKIIKDNIKLKKINYIYNYIKKIN